MKKNLFKTIFPALIISIGVNPTFASDDVVCPTSVRVGKPLTVTATIKNSNCDSELTINKTIVSLIGNSGKSGSSGLQGPFINNLTTSKVVPIATCPEYCDWYDEDGDGVTEEHCNGNRYLETEGKATLNTQIIAKVPSGMKNQMASAVVAVLDSNKKIHTVGACLVEVKP